MNKVHFYAKNYLGVKKFIFIHVQLLPNQMNGARKSCIICKTCAHDPEKVQQYAYNLPNFCA